MCLVEVVVVQKEGLGREEGTYQSERPGEGLCMSSQGLIRSPVGRAGNRSIWVPLGAGLSSWERAELDSLLHCYTEAKAADLQLG